MLAGKPACISRRMAWTALRIDVDPELRCCCAVGNGLANPSDVYVLGGSEGACVACHSAALTSSAHFPPMGTGGTTQGATDSGVGDGGGHAILVMQYSSFSTKPPEDRSEEHTSELQSLRRIQYAVFCLKKT